MIYPSVEELFKDAIDVIDAQFGSGYAKQHPELIASFLHFAGAETLTKMLHEVLPEQLGNIALSIHPPTWNQR